MHHTLFEILTGQYADGTPLPERPDIVAVSNSIRDHLGRLLNARQGTLRHLPDYGLPDIAQIYHGLPYSVDELVEAIRDSILKYEPRLQQVDVRNAPLSRGDAVLRLEVIGTLHSGDHVHFETVFLSEGLATVRELKRQREG